MGEQADLIIDAMLGENYHNTRFRPPKREKPLIRCRICNSKTFHWRLTKFGWRLFNRLGEIHRC